MFYALAKASKQKNYPRVIINRVVEEMFVWPFALFYHDINYWIVFNRRILSYDWFFRIRHIFFPWTFESIIAENEQIPLKVW